MGSLISFTALFLSIFLAQLGNGALAPLDALSGAALDFTNQEIGLLGSAHFLGFIIGCFTTPRIMGQVGHSRAFSALAAVGAISALLHPISQDAYVWAVLRVSTGIAVAGCYTVVESWLQAQIDNANRGRMFGVYRLVDMTGSLLAQGMIAFLEPAAYISYNILAMFCCLSLLPLALTKRAPPPMPETPKVRPWKAFMLSPIAALGIVVSGLSTSSLRMVGPIFGAEKGLDNKDIAVFLIVWVLGGALAQTPMGWLADKVDRRKVLIGVALLSVLACIGLSHGIYGESVIALWVGIFVFGFVSFPLYSLSAALANDRAPADFIVELSASLMLFYSLGAIISPFLTALLIEHYGPEAMLYYIASAHAFLLLYGLYRMKVRPTANRKNRYRFMPRTSMIWARLLKRNDS